MRERMGASGCQRELLSCRLPELGQSQFSRRSKTSYNEGMTSSSKLQELIAMLDEATTSGDPNHRCHKVKNVLEHICAAGEDFIDERFLRPAPERYARRLVHKDPAGRYTVLAM